MTSPIRLSCVLSYRSRVAPALGVLATILGFGGGLLVSRGIVFLFNQAGAGFPAPDIVISFRTIGAAVVVGVGVDGVVVKAAVVVGACIIHPSIAPMIPPPPPPVMNGDSKYPCRLSVIRTIWKMF